MIHLKKLIMSLALLLTAATGAWAESKPIGLNVEYAAGDEITSTTDVYVYYGDEAGSLKKMGVKITSTQPLKISWLGAHSFGINGNAAWYYLTDGDAIVGYAEDIPCFGESTGDATVVHVASGSGTLADPYVFAPGSAPAAPAGTPVDLTRGTGEKINEWTLTNGMPAGNVLLNVAYKDRATMALTYGGTAITTEANAVTVFKGCEQEFAEALTPAVQNIEPTFNSGTAQDVTTTLAADFTFKSSDAAIIGFKSGETYADEGTLDQMEFRALTTTPVTLTVTYKGTDDLESKSQALLVTIEKKTYTVSLADGTEDAGNWSIEPKEGLSEGDQVTIQYSGRLKVKSVTATTDAVPAYAANEYNEADWDYGDKKVIFTKQTAASVTAVTNSDTDVTWGDGWYTVSGNVTINGKVTLSAHTHLILQDGATLTINGQLNAGYDLYIYGQMEGTGKLNVTCNDNAIEGSKGMTTHIHGGEITATATGDSHHGLYFGKIMMYSGKLTATAADYGIGSNTYGINVYGGEVEGIANAASDTHHGIKCNGILMVYGGKVKGTGNANGQGIYGKIKSSTSNIKFYFHADGATWGDGAYYGDAVEAPAIRYAKAE